MFEPRKQEYQTQQNGIWHSVHGNSRATKVQDIWHDSTASLEDSVNQEYLLIIFNNIYSWSTVSTCFALVCAEWLDSGTHQTDIPDPGGLPCALDETVYYNKPLSFKSKFITSTWTIKSKLIILISREINIKVCSKLDYLSWYWHCLYLKNGLVLCTMPSFVLSLALVNKLLQPSGRVLASTANPWFCVVM